MKRRYRILFFLIGIAGIAVMVSNAKKTGANWSELYSPRILLLLAALCLLWFLIYAVHTKVYLTVLGGAARKVGFLNMYMICAVGFALNNVTPAGLVGGEPYRIMELSRYTGKNQAASATLTFTLLYVAGHVCLWLSGILIYFALGRPGTTYLTVLLALVALVFAGCLLLFCSVKKRGFLQHLVDLLARAPLLKRLFTRIKTEHSDSITEIDAAFLSLRSQPAQFLSSVLLEFFARILEGFEYYLLFSCLGAHMTLFDGILLLTMASLVGNLFFFVPMQAGTREGGMVIALHWLGVDPGISVMGGLIYRVRDLFFTMLGVILIFCTRKKTE